MTDHRTCVECEFWSPYDINKPSGPGGCDSGCRDDRAAPHGSDHMCPVALRYYELGVAYDEARDKLTQTVTRRDLFIAAAVRGIGWNEIIGDSSMADVAVEIADALLKAADK